MSDVTLREAPLRFTSNLGEGDEARKADTLNLLPYAEALRDFIHDCESPTSIGIQGEWGSGKTSLLNSIYHAYTSESTFKQIWINSWEYSLLSTP